MEIAEKIYQDYKDALKQGNKEMVSVLSFLRADLLNTAVAKKKNTLDDAEVIAVIKKQIKARQDAIMQFRQGNRLDLADKETREIEILQRYLPPQLPLEEIERIITETIARLGAQGMKDMGRVMKELNASLAAKADMKWVSEKVCEKLQAG